MVPRVISALVAIPLFLLIAWAGSLWLTILVALIAVAGVVEFCGMASAKGGRPYTLFSILWALSLVLTGHFIALNLAPNILALPVIGIGFLVSLVGLLLRKPGEKRLSDWGFTVGAALYVGGFLSFVLLLRGLDQGWQWVYLVLLTTFATDTAAFFVGRAIGHRPLALTISPGKTWEGAVGGFIAALGVSVLLGYILALPISLLQAILLGALIGLFAQVGDLVESFLKRSVGVKESGWVIPGHGGVLDRLDSIVLNMVVVYYFIIWLVQ